MRRANCPTRVQGFFVFEIRARNQRRTLTPIHGFRDFLGCAGRRDHACTESDTERESSSQRSLKRRAQPLFERVETGRAGGGRASQLSSGDLPGERHDLGIAPPGGAADRRAFGH